MAVIFSEQVFTSSRICSGVISSMKLWVTEWFSISQPMATARRTISADSGVMFWAMRKKVPTAPFSSRISSTWGVMTVFGPSSKVRAMFGIETSGGICNEE